MTHAVPTYAEFLPRPALRPWVECFWVSASDHAAGTATQRVTPDGCLDIIFSLGPAGSLWSAEHGDAACGVVGVMTRPLTVSVGRGADVVAVRFRPGRAHGFLNLSVAELTDRSAEVGEVWGRPGRLLAERLQETADTRSRLAILERALLERLPRAESHVTGLEGAIEHVVARGGDVTVEKLSAVVGSSRQHLARRFPAVVGLSPKMFCRVLRFRAAVESMRARRRASWAQVAAEAGYYDQAHLIAEFRTFAGTTPTGHAG